MEHTVRILEINDVTHDVKSFRLEKPDDYTFIPGQATDVSVNKPGWEGEKRPFTFTSLNEYPYLEFTIKGYKDHDGVTNQVHQLQVGDELIIGDVWGTIAYRGTGCFIAGGAGITPFIAILRQLHKQGNLAGCMLLFSNKTRKDIIYEAELNNMLGDNFIAVVTDERPSMKPGTIPDPRHLYGRIDRDFLKGHIKDFKAHFYVCGPDKMVSDINALLAEMGADVQNVVFEK